MKTFDDNSVDLVVCDPPYALTDAKWDSAIQLDKLWEQYNRIVKPTGTIVLFGQQPFSSTLVESNRKAFSHIWYWMKNNKTGGLNVKHMPMKCIEEILVFRMKGKTTQKPSFTYNPQGLIKLENAKTIHKTSFGELWGKVKQSSYKPKYTNYPVHVLSYKHDTVRYHPTQKPVKLLEYLIKTYSNEGDVVLDNTMGSGSTGVACVRTKRNFIGIELEDNYYDVAKERIKKEKEGN